MLKVFLRFSDLYIFPYPARHGQSATEDDYSPSGPRNSNGGIFPSLNKVCAYRDFEPSKPYECLADS